MPTASGATIFRNNELRIKLIYNIKYCKYRSNKKLKILMPQRMARRQMRSIHENLINNKNG